MPVSTIDPDCVTRGTPEYDEVSRILGSQRLRVLADSARQINTRWLKASFIKLDSRGRVIRTPTGIEYVSRRIRIPKDSFLHRRRFVSKRGERHP